MLNEAWHMIRAWRLGEIDQARRDKELRNLGLSESAIRRDVALFKDRPFLATELEANP